MYMGQMGRRFSAFGRGEKGKEIKFWVDFGMENIYLGCLVKKKRGRKKKKDKIINGTHKFLSFQCWKEK